MVLATSIARTVLTRWFEHVEIVTTNEVLSQVDDSGRQTLFAMMVSSVFTNITNKLGNLDIDMVNHVATDETLCIHTLISPFNFRLKQPHMTFLWPGFSPSATEGIDRILSAIEKRINSLLMNSE